MRENPTDLEALTDEVIERVEAGFARFKEIVLIEISQMPDTQFKNELLLAFSVMEANQKNPEKNAERVKKSGRLVLNNFYQFFYMIGDTPGYESLYEPKSRTLVIKEIIDSDNLIDMLVIYHELQHIKSDGRLRQNMKTEDERRTYRNFYNNGRKTEVLIEEEISAYIYEAATFTLLRKKIRESGKTDDADSILKELGGRPEQIDIVKGLITISDEGVISRGSVQKPYVERVSRLIIDAQKEDARILLGTPLNNRPL